MVAAPLSTGDAEGSGISPRYQTDRSCCCPVSAGGTPGAKVVSHGRYIAFQMAEVAIPRQIFQEILRLIAEPRPQPPPVLA
jgi:hypothetical protein